MGNRISPNEEFAFDLLKNINDIVSKFITLRKCTIGLIIEAEY